MISADYPRPDLIRHGWWASLDGVWQLALGDSADFTDVLVPSPWESERSMVSAHWVERGRYRRTVDLPETPAGQQLILHFQAVHYRAEVFVDATSVGVHVGGQLPFEIDLTQHSGRSVELGVLVDAPDDKAEIPHGKQRSMPADPYDVCSFTPCSGIWQSVWLEQRSTTHLRSLRLVSAGTLDRFEVTAECDGPAAQCTITVSVDESTDSVILQESRPAQLMLTNPRPWSPDDPQLYAVTARLWRNDQLLDAVTCTTGLRTVTADGATLRLNGQRVYLRGVLDQGYWPTSGWTAPEAGALEADMLAAKAAGFNLVRKHLKLEDPRWLHAADRLGMLVWEEPPSTSVFSEDAVSSYQAQLRPMVERDQNHPSIVVWGLYNEEWGLDWDVAGDPAKAQVLERARKEVVAVDPTRPVVDNSGWSHVSTDLVDWHIYAPDQTVWRSALQTLESGFEVELGPGGRQHKNLFADGRSTAGRPVLNSEYGTGVTSVERAWIMRWQTQELRRLDDQNGYVYCELYDIEHETAGVMTFDRRSKDGLGLCPADTHAETVLILDVDPIRPGTDLETSDGRLAFGVRVSSHAPAARRLTLHTGWGAPLSRDIGSDAGTDAGVATFDVTPFQTCEPVTLSEQLPPETTWARLHLWLQDGETRVAHTVLDVRREEAASSRSGYAAGH